MKLALRSAMRDPSPIVRNYTCLVASLVPRLNFENGLKIRFYLANLHNIGMLGRFKLARVFQLDSE